MKRLGIRRIMFEKNTITAFPTDTSWGLAVRADDIFGLEKLAKLKGRKEGQYFSLIVRDTEMLREFAEVPDGFDEFVERELGWIPNQVWNDSVDFFFNEKPRTAILKPTEKLPKSKYWPEKSVAFRVSTISKVSEQIIYPITATSANLTGENPIFSAREIREKFGNTIQIFLGFDELPEREASEIWDFTNEALRKLR